VGSSNTGKTAQERYFTPRTYIISIDFLFKKKIYSLIFNQRKMYRAEAIQRKVKIFRFHHISITDVRKSKKEKVPIRQMSVPVDHEFFMLYPPYRDGIR
jgi:hypothetical protein